MTFKERACFRVIRMMDSDDDDGDSEHSKIICLKSLKIIKDNEILSFG